MPKLALQKLDSRKKWNKRKTKRRDDGVGEGLPNSLLNSEGKTSISSSIRKQFNKFIENFIDSGFNTVLHSVTNYYTTEQDRIVTLEQVEYLLFFGWFLKYQVLRCRFDKSADIDMVAEASFT